MIKHLENMGTFFEDGGNLFVFPEGTRSRGTDLRVFYRGVFKIARMYHRPIEVLGLSNTDKLFPPGKFVFETWKQDIIRMERIGCVNSAVRTRRVSVADLEKEVRQIFQKSSMFAGAL